MGQLSKFLILNIITQLTTVSTISRLTYVTDIPQGWESLMDQLNGFKHQKRLRTTKLDYKKAFTYTTD